MENKTVNQTEGLKMGQSFKPIEVKWAKIVSSCWPVTEASATLYFNSKAWRRNAVSAEVEESGNKIIFKM